MLFGFHDIKHLSTVPLNDFNIVSDNTPLQQPMFHLYHDELNE